MRWLELDICRVDLETGDVTTRARPGDAPIRLTSRELMLLRSLAAHPGQVIGRDLLLGEVFGYAANTVSRAVDKAMDSLRTKVERDKSSPAHLVTVHGQGYRFVPSAQRVPGPSRRPDGFVGRDEESAALRASVDSSGFVTVLGPGGIGKTRLVLEVFAGSEPALAMCDLSACRTLADVLGEAERVLGLGPGNRDQDARIERLTEIARAGNRRIVLDNAEHVVEAVRAIAVACANVGAVMVATSRVRLDVPGERLVSVGGLDRAAGQALFLARAPAADAAAPDPERDADDIDAIVELVDGFPLAIELAARRTVLLPVRELRRRLEQTFALLSGPPAGVPARHRDVARTVAWSWDLLSEAERDVLVDLTVFEGGFDLDAAEAVVAPHPLGPPVVDLVQALLDASLIRRRTDGRMALYEVVRQFARERLSDARRRAVGERHGRWFAALGDRLGVEVRYGVEPLDQLERELGNLRAVYAADSGATIAQRLDARLAVHAWMRIRGGYPEREVLLDAAVAESVGSVTEARVMALNARALLDSYRGIPSPNGAYDEAYALAEALGDPVLTVRTQLCEALAMRMARRPDEARRILAAASAVPLDDAWITANLTYEALSLEADSGAAGPDLPERYARMVDGAAHGGFSWLEAIGRLNLGRIHHRLDHPTEARRQLLRALELGLALRSAHVLQLAELAMAHVALDLEHWDDVVHHARRGLELARVEGDREGVADACLVSAIVAARDEVDPQSDRRAEAHAAAGIAARPIAMPQSALLHLVRSVALARMGRSTEARDALAQVEPSGVNRLVEASRRITAAIVDARAADGEGRAQVAAVLDALGEGPRHYWVRSFAAFAARELRGLPDARRVRVVD